MPGPTPTIADLERILEAVTRRSLDSGAIASLACFSEVDEKEILQLRWKDLEWRDDGISSYWELRILRRGRKTRVFVVSPGAQPLLRHGLSSGLERDAFVLQGRMPGTPLSERAFCNDLRITCCQAGWPKATRPQLISAFAAWLHDKGMDDHDIRMTLGRRRAVSIDRMMRWHKQLEVHYFSLGLTPHNLPLYRCPGRRQLRRNSGGWLLPRRSPFSAIRSFSLVVPVGVSSDANKLPISPSISVTCERKNAL